MPEKSNKGLYFLFCSIICTGGLYVIPYGYQIGYPLILLSTLAHEMGHGIAAMLIGGEFSKFCLYQDASGVAYTSTSSGISAAIVSAGGLVGPAIVGAVFFAFAHKGKILFTSMGVFLLLAEILVVRNTFGLAFVGVCTVLCFFLANRNTAMQQMAAYFVGIQLAMSVFSRGDYLFTEYAETGAGKMPSDVAHIAEALWLPYWFWGGLCGIFSVMCLVWGIRRAIQNL